EFIIRMDIGRDAKTLRQVTGLAGVIQMSMGQHNGFDGEAMLLAQFNDSTHRVHARIHDKGTLVVLDDIGIRFVWTCTKTQNLHEDHPIASLHIPDNKKLRPTHMLRANRSEKSMFLLQCSKILNVIWFIGVVIYNL